MRCGLCGYVENFIGIVKISPIGGELKINLSIEEPNFIFCVDRLENESCVWDVVSARNLGCLPSSFIHACSH